VITHQRPSDILAFEGSALERLLFDAEVLRHASERISTVEDEIKRKMARLGVMSQYVR